MPMSLSIEMDVSPAIINKTAVHHMVLDIGQHLAAAYNLTLSITGQVLTKSKTPQEFLEKLIHREEQAFKKADHKPCYQYL